MMDLYEILLQSANSGLSLLNPETGSMPSGHNGLYYDPETSVRNTSHWLITFLKAYSISHQKKFLEAAQRTTAYLCSREARPMEATFWHRKNPKKDTCNGLIGQAWTIEALIIAAQELEMPELITLAKKVFLLHPFNENIGLWQRVGVDGTYLSFDMTFNHQLWFAAAGGLLAKYTAGEVETRVRYFMDGVIHHFNVHHSGLIRHRVAMNKFKWRQRILHLVNLPGLLRESKYLAYKEVGYHSFNLYGFALLKQQYPDHAFWGSTKFKSALNYAQSEAYLRDIKDNQYGYPYNPSGFEMAFALEVFFTNNRSEQERWLSEQLRHCYDFESHMMTRGTKDPVTHAARLYEATRLPNLAVCVGDGYKQLS